MTQYNKINIKLSNSQLNKLKLATKNETEVIIRISPNMIGDSNDETNFPHELLLTDRQVSSICKALTNNSSANIKFSETQLSKMIQSGGCLGKLLDPLLKTGLPLIKSVITRLAKSVLIPLGLTAVASAADAGIHKKNLRIREYNTSNIKWWNRGYFKIVKYLEDSGLLLKGVTVQNEVKEQNDDFLVCYQVHWVQVY